MNDKNKSQEKIVKKVTTKTVKKDSRGKNISITQFADLEGKFLHIKVGSYEFPASPSQIDDIQEKIISLLNKNNVNCLVFVTHHAVSMEIIEKKVNGEQDVEKTSF